MHQWLHLFKSGRPNIHDEDRSGWPSVVSDELIQKIDEKVCENQRFTISAQFAQFLGPFCRRKS